MVDSIPTVLNSDGLVELSNNTVVDSFPVVTSAIDSDALEKILDETFIESDVVATGCAAVVRSSEDIVSYCVIVVGPIVKGFHIIFLNLVDFNVFMQNLRDIFHII